MILKSQKMKRYWIKQVFSVLWMITIVVFLFSCTDDNGRQVIQKDPGIEKHFEKGLIQVTLSTDKSEITTAERLSLSLSVFTDENHTIQWPSVDQYLGQFRVFDDQTAQPELDDKNRKKTVRTYILEPFLAGEYTIPSMQITFGQAGENSKDKNGIVLIETEAFTIPVRSVFPDIKPDRKPHDIKPPVDISRSHVFWAWVIAIVCLLLIVTFFVVIMLRKKRKKKDTIEIRLSAHEIAFRELSNLAIPTQMEKMEIKLFYQKISDILRKYIENRFGVNAPDQTTEEFLTGMDFRNIIEPSHKPLLRNFLAQCDLVKFAEHRPGKADIEETFGRCRDFINQTKIEQYS
ncbi:MAG: hypothetical protein C0403_18620 [Desulfobacterium sp.]|nr:hypothetical protein [Desulfobacterium sp.]